MTKNILPTLAFSALLASAFGASANETSKILKTGSEDTYRAIYVSYPGSLCDEITEEEKYTILDLLIMGEIDGTDIRFIREMAGVDVEGKSTEGKLKSIDLEAATIVEGGDPYFTSPTTGDLYTSDNYIGPHMFEGCPYLTSFTMPIDVVTLGQQAFSGCVSLENFYFSDVEVIGPNAFSNTALTDVILPESVKEIWADAFAYNSHLTSLYFGKNVEKWANCCLDCPNLMKYVVSESNPYIEAIDDVLFTRNHILLAYPQGKAGVYTIPDGTEAVYSRAFMRSNNPQEVNFCSSMIEVDANAFYDCGLEAVSINEGLKTIGSYAFYSCGNLKEIVIPDTVEELGESAFSECDALQEAVLGEGILEIKTNTFNYDAALTKVKLGSNVQVIGGYAFNDCNALSEINIPETLSYLETGAFDRCNSLKSIELPEGLEYIGEFCFSECDFSEITIPSTVTEVGNEAFAWNRNLVKVSCKSVTPPACKDRSFILIGPDPVLYVPAESIDAYKEAEGWRKFSQIIGETSGVIEIGAAHFISVGKGSLSVNASSQNFSVYTIEGVKVAEGIADGTSIEIPAGLYIVYCGDLSHKVIIK